MILREILSPQAKRFGERIERSRAQSQSNLRQERERNARLLNPDGDSDVSSMEAQQGRRLHRTEVVRRIKKLNPNIWYETSIRYPAQGGLYIEDGRSPYRKRLLVGMPDGIVNEFSTVLTKPALIPDMTVAAHWQTIQQVDSKLPGWRAVLLKLLMEGIVSMAGVEKEFQISKGRSSQFWQAAVN